MSEQQLQSFKHYTETQANGSSLFIENFMLNNVTKLGNINNELL